MKRIHILLCVVLVLHGSLCAQLPPVAGTQQKEKPFLFSALPDEFECNFIELQKILQGAPGEHISAQLSDQFRIEGEIIFKKQTQPGVISINTRLTNYRNALFNISIRLLANNSTNIQGRIIHPNYGDVIILERKKDKYYFKKNLQRLYMTE
jgi:hypothetical protein